MKEYKEQLLKELETDRVRKVRVVFTLYIFSLLIVLAIYFSNTDFAEIEQMILRALDFDRADIEFD